MTTLTTSIGDSRVAHRLALAVECIDAMTKRTASAPVQIIRENDVPNSTPAQRYVRTDPGFVPRGPGRALLLHGRRTPTSVTVRISDTARQFVPRRLKVPLSSLTDAIATERGEKHVLAASRLIRPSLLPGSGYPFVRGTTGLRGAVAANGVAVRWPRIVAKDAGGVVVGWAHGDERGEFVMVLDIPFVLPTKPDTFDITLFVSAPALRRTPEADPLDDLVIENVARPDAADSADRIVLQGRAIPPGYRTAVFPVDVKARLGALVPIDQPLAITL